MAKIKEGKKIAYMMRYPWPRLRAKIAKSRTLYLCFGLSSVASLVDFRGTLELFELPVPSVNDSELVVL
jgi:hypothetical protein